MHWHRWKIWKNVTKTDVFWWEKWRKILHWFIRKQFYQATNRGDRIKVYLYLLGNFPCIIEDFLTLLTTNFIFRSKTVLVWTVHSQKFVQWTVYGLYGHHGQIAQPHAANLQNKGHVLVLMGGMVVSNVTVNLKRRPKIVKPRYVTANSWEWEVVYCLLSNIQCGPSMTSLSLSIPYRIIKVFWIVSR